MSKPRSLLSRSKLSRQNSLIIMGALAVLGILLVVWVRAGGAAATQTITLNKEIKNDGRLKTGVTSAQTGQYDVCFQIDDPTPNTGITSQAYLYAKRPGTSSTGTISKTVSLTSPDYLEPKQVCLDSPISTADNGIEYGVQALNQGNINVREVSFGVHGGFAGGVEQLGWRLNSEPTKGRIFFDTNKFPNTSAANPAFKVCFNAQSIRDDQKSSSASFQLGTLSKREQASTGIVTVSPDARLQCANQTVYSDGTDSLWYTVTPLVGSHLKLTSIVLTAVDNVPPTQPTELRARQMGGNPRKVRLQWVASYDEGEGPVDNYVVYKNGKPLSGTPTFVESKDGIPHYRMVVQVKAETYHRFYVVAVDDAGNRSQPSKTIRFKTKRFSPQ